MLYPTIFLSYFVEETEMCELYTLINEQKIEITKMNEDNRQVSVLFCSIIPYFFNERICFYYICFNSLVYLILFLFRFL